MRHGFSLVELSIVLVILGLLAGGVLTGQSLIRAAELRSVTTEFTKYQAAVNTFRDKYFALPGDMANATSFWGAAHATPATCLTTVGTGTQTCNGDGDGVIEFAAIAGQRAEYYAFWHHLSSAGLIEGSYSGFSGAASQSNSVISVNVPRSKIASAGWTAGYLDFGNTTVNYTLASHYGNTLMFGASTNWETLNPIVKPEEAWNIDAKIDDGKPARGKVIARFWNNLCAAADDGTHATDDLNASYKLSDTSVQCALFFVNAF